MRLVAFACFLLMSLSSAWANGTHDIKISDAHARATFALASTGAVYFTVNNSSEEPTSLIGVSVNKDLADEAQIHTTQMVGEMVKMRHVKEGIKLLAHQVVKFMPGGHHVMLLGLKKPLKDGDKIKLQLHFDNGVTKNVDVDVHNNNQSESHAGHHSQTHH